MYESRFARRDTSEWLFSRNMADGKELTGQSVDLQAAVERKNKLSIAEGAPGMTSSTAKAQTIQ
jgi:hypothetical protein